METTTRKRGRPPRSDKVAEVLEALRERDTRTIDLTLDRPWLTKITRSPEDLLLRMHRQGLVHRVQAGRYLANVDGRPSSRPRIDALDPMAALILARLDVDYFLSWHSGLWHYGLLDQQASRLFVALPEARKRQARVGIYDIRFVTLTRDRFFGATTIDDFDVPLQMAEAERALIDSFDRPALAAPVEVVANALRRAWRRELLDVEKLVAYAIKFDSKAVIRRVGFFLDLYEIPGSNALAKEVGRKSAMPLAPGRTPTRRTPVNSRWLVYEDPTIVENAKGLK